MLSMQGILIQRFQRCIRIFNGRRHLKGGYVNGRNEIREYWTRQWTEINPNVRPLEFNERQDGTLEITVHQKVKDLQDNTIFDGIVRHTTGNLPLHQTRNNNVHRKHGLFHGLISQIV